MSKFDILNIINFPLKILNFFGKMSDSCFEEGSTRGFTENEKNEALKDLRTIATEASIPEQRIQKILELKGLFGGLPRFSNLYYCLITDLKIPVPEWFFRKYRSVEHDMWFKRNQDLIYDV